jgi:hypothetical protein
MDDLPDGASEPLERLVGVVGNKPLAAAPLLAGDADAAHTCSHGCVWEDVRRAVDGFIAVGSPQLDDLFVIPHTCAGDDRSRVLRQRAHVEARGRLVDAIPKRVRKQARPVDKVRVTHLELRVWKIGDTGVAVPLGIREAGRGPMHLSPIGDPQGAVSVA